MGKTLEQFEEFFKNCLCKVKDEMKKSKDKKEIIVDLNINGKNVSMSFEKTLMLTEQIVNISLGVTRILQKFDVGNNGENEFYKIFSDYFSSGESKIKYYLGVLGFNLKRF